MVQAMRKIRRFKVPPRFRWLNLAKTSTLLLGFLAPSLSASALELPSTPEASHVLLNDDGTLTYVDPRVNVNGRWYPLGTSQTHRVPFTIRETGFCRRMGHDTDLHVPHGTTRIPQMYFNSGIVAPNTKGEELAALTNEDGSLYGISDYFNKITAVTCLPSNTHPEWRPVRYKRKRVNPQDQSLTIETPHFFHSGKMLPPCGSQPQLNYGLSLDRYCQVLHGKKRALISKMVNHPDFQFCVRFDRDGNDEKFAYLTLSMSKNTVQTITCSGENFEKSTWAHSDR